MATPQSNHINLEHISKEITLKADISKNTTRTLLSVLVLIIFSFLAESNVLANNDNLTKYQSQLLISHNTATPIELARFYRDGILYTNQGKLYFNQKQIDLLNSVEGDLGLKVNDIYVEAKDFYLATDIGIFHNYRRIFTKESCNQVIKTPSKIFAACLRGIYSADIEKKTLQTDFKWQLDENSPANPNFMNLNKAKSAVSSASADNGFYYYDSRKHKWLNRSYGLKRDFYDSFGFGRFLITKDSGVIYLATSSGVYVSSNQGQTWLKFNDGLRSNPDGFYTIRQISILDDQLILLSANGIYSSLINNHPKWKLIDINNSKNDNDYNPSYYSLDLIKSNNEEKHIISNSQGQIFTLSFAPVITGSIILEDAENGSPSTAIPETITTELTIPETSVTAEVAPAKTPVNELVYKILSAEPKIQELHKIALEFAGIPTGQNFSTYKRQARMRNIIPDIDAFANKANQNFLSIETNANDSFTSSTSSISSDYEENNINKDDNNINTGLKFSWKLGNLIYDPEINNINTSARITANIRENILTELTQIYYARKELLYKLLDQSFHHELQEVFTEKLKLSEYTAQLDARTGAWFSSELEKRVVSMLNRDHETPEKDKLLALYID